MFQDPTDISRRAVIGLVASGAIVLATGRAHAQPRSAIMVWKDPNCGAQAEAQIVSEKLWARARTSN